MTLRELNQFFNEILRPQDFSDDPSMNGIQVQNSDMDKPIKKVAFAVDACLETILRAKEAKADVLVVHHGIFWGSSYTLVGSAYEKIKSLMDADMALYAAHLPLDANKEVGNNYGLAKRLGLQNLEGFGFWRGMEIGVKGKFESPRSIDQVISKLFVDNQKPFVVLPFGKKEISTVGIISGGANHDVSQAIDEGLDLYITGEIGHDNYHQCLENKINYIAGGHYQTETVGVNLLRKKLEQEKNIETVFIDVPTGL